MIEPPLCTNCKHNDQALWCLSPQTGVSWVDGGVLGSNCRYQRSAHLFTSPGDKCGPEGLWFEPHPINNNPETLMGRVFKRILKVISK